MIARRLVAVSLGVSLVACSAEPSPANVEAVGNGRLTTAPACSSTGVQRLLAVLVNFPASSLVATPAYVQSLLGDPVLPSVDGFYKEVSYGLTSYRSTVVGPFTVERAYTCSLADQQALRDAALRAAGGAVDASQFNRIVVIAPLSPGCNSEGMAELACETFTTPLGGTATASTAWIFDDTGSSPGFDFGSRTRAVSVIAHEEGHNLGLEHSNLSLYSGAPIGDIGVPGSSLEYGDSADMMGSGKGHFNVEHKVALGWLGAADVPQVTSSGTFVIAPIEAPSGVRGLRIARGYSPEVLWAEYRQPVGYDAYLGTELPPSATSGVFIHHGPQPAGDTHTQLLDFDPGSLVGDVTLLPGTTWVDPYSNLSIAVSNPTPSGITVQVIYDTSCTPGIPSFASTPATQVVDAGRHAVFFARLSNGNSRGCPPWHASFATQAPSGWTVFTPAPVTVYSGHAVTLGYAATPPLNAVDGTYPVALAVTGDVSGTAPASVAVTGGYALSLAMSPSASSFKVGTPLAFTATLVAPEGGSPAGIHVRIALVFPNGQVQAQSGTTDVAGNFVWINNQSQAGLYTVTAQTVDATIFGSATAGPIQYSLQ